MAKEYKEKYGTSSSSDSGDTLNEKSDAGIIALAA